MKEELISVIIPIYNVERFLEKCIESIIKQTYKKIEIFLIDDGSTDQSGIICDKYKKKDKRISVIHKKNEGVSIARNVGIENANGKYITFVDADDYLEKDMYKKLIEVFENPTIDISMCNFFMEYLEKDIRANKNSNYIYNKKELMNKIFLTDYFCGFVWNKIYKTSIIKKNKIFFKNNIHICEDLLFNCQYFSFIKKGFYTEDKLYHYILLFQ